MLPDDRQILYIISIVFMECNRILFIKAKGYEISRILDLDHLY